MEEPIWQPVLLSVSLSPNPVTINNSVTIRVKAIDVLGGEQPEEWFSGDLQSGEV